jgi:hypothetical protein
MNPLRFDHLVFVRVCRLLGYRPRHILHKVGRGGCHGNKAVFLEVAQDIIHDLENSENEAQCNYSICLDILFQS